MSEEWTTEMTAKLCDLVETGMTASQIAEALSTPRGRLTRNAVIGRAHRLGLKIGHGEKQWNAETDATLRRLWAEGWSTRQIARDLRLQSSSNVSWRAAEIGLDPRRQGSTLKIRPTVSPVAAPTPVPEPAAAVPIATPKPASTPRAAAGPLHFLDGQSGRCRFPLWSNDLGIPIEQKFVCAAPAGSSAYCPEHADRCFGVASWGQRAWRTKSPGVAA